LCVIPALKSHKKGVNSFAVFNQSHAFVSSHKRELYLGKTTTTGFGTALSEVKRNFPSAVQTYAHRVPRTQVEEIYSVEDR
jgi:hypothetical protein